MERAVKPSQLPQEVWEQKLFIELEKRKMILSSAKESSAAMNKAQATKEMPPEYKKRKLHQGMQRKYTRWIKGRVIEVFTTWSDQKEGKKEGYSAWVIMKGKNIQEKLFSFQIVESPSFFDIILAYVDAWIDIAEHWPVCDQCAEELRLEHIEGIMHMMKFECHTKHSHRQRRPSFKIIEGPFSKKTVAFLKKKFMPSYHAQLRAREKGEILPVSRRVTRAEKRKEALHKK